MIWRDIFAMKRHNVSKYVIVESLYEQRGQSDEKCLWCGRIMIKRIESSGGKLYISLRLYWNSPLEEQTPLKMGVNYNKIISIYLVELCMDITAHIAPIYQSTSAINKCVY